MTTTLDDILQRLTSLPEAKRKEIEALATTHSKSMRWVPNPGPQTDAYFSKADVLLFGGEPGGGKLLSLDTPIPTPFGWTTMGEIKVGDLVLDECGEPCSVVGKSSVETEATYRLTFSDGSEVVAGARHQWVTSTRADRMRELKCNDEWRASRRASRPSRGTGKRPDLALRNTATATSQNLPTRSIRTTQEIADSLLVAGKRVNHAIDVCGALQLPEADLLVEPYTLGAWLGDGTSSSGAITGLDEEIFANVANAGYTVTRYTNVKTRGVLGLQSQLKQLGVFNNKHIPPAYLRASFDQRLELLQGLMDTDGHCDVRGQCEIQLTRKDLIDGVLELINSLGIKAQMRTGTARLYGRDIGQKWRIKFLTEHPAFKLPRKLLAQKRSGFRGTHDVRYIERCDPVDPVAMQCIQVDSANHMYLCGRAMIPTHNSQLILGLAFNEHKRSLVMRRQYSDLDRIVEDALTIHGSRVGFNGSPPPKLRISDTQTISFAAAHRVGDEQGQMGKGRDLLGIDEATHFAKSQIQFLMGWNRSEDPNQRVRTVLATNPPLSAEGLWVIEMFAPWLDPAYPVPAEPGELRWVITDPDGNDEWVADSSPVVRNGKEYRPMSRTYIPSSVDDNPEYANSDYKRQLEAMPEPFRSLLMGGFRTEFKDNPNQVIPTAWVIAAQARWTNSPPENVPMSAIAADATGGGNDPMIVACRHDAWFAPLVEIPAKDIPIDKLGPTAAGVVVANRRDQAEVTIDMGGGYGNAMYGILKNNGIEVNAYKGAEGYRGKTKDGKMAFYNTRSAAIWRLREALDPGQPGGSRIALPQDKALAADLTAPTLDMEYNGIKVESKEKVCARLGRSTDRGDAVVMAWWKGPTLANAKGGIVNRKQLPKVIMGHQASRR